jgi:hypothetical protein
LSLGFLLALQRIVVEVRPNTAQNVEIKKLEIERLEIKVLEKDGRIFYDRRYQSKEEISVNGRNK